MGRVQVIVTCSLRCLSFCSEFITFHFKRQRDVSNFFFILLAPMKFQVSPCVISSTLNQYFVESFVFTYLQKRDQVSLYFIK